ncbi:hypothetical protein MMC21_004953 [Puttea exsequens]|nr:hypothetical protein [Puttea exsequens]
MFEQAPSQKMLALRSRSADTPQRSLDHISSQSDAPTQNATRLKWVRGTVTRGGGDAGRSSNVSTIVETRDTEDAQSKPVNKWFEASASDDPDIEAEQRKKQHLSSPGKSNKRTEMSDDHNVEAEQRKKQRPSSPAKTKEKVQKESRED